MTVLETANTKTDLDPVEVRRRVAVLKRFRELLRQQRDRFAEYLEVLDKQKNVIESGSADELIAHVELEEKIVSDIFSIQKVIDPLEDMYQSLLPAKSTKGHIPVLADTVTAEEEKEGLKSVLEELKAEAVIRSERNRELLAKRMAELRLEMNSIRANPYALRRSVYSGEIASLVDIKG
ncbi:MAG: flagellar biosynthesis protein FlgN [Treponema sp.]|nr:flagellar biosynthesis protein FlgN [Treponema sp.]